MAGHFYEKIFLTTVQALLFGGRAKGWNGRTVAQRLDDAKRCVRQAVGIGQLDLIDQNKSWRIL